MGKWTLPGRRACLGGHLGHIGSDVIVWDDCHNLRVVSRTFHQMTESFVGITVARPAAGLMGLSRHLYQQDGEEVIESS